MQKRLLTIVLVIALMVTLLPSTVLAAGAVYPVSNPSQLRDALDSIQDGDTIELTADFEYPYPISINGMAITFQLNGHTLNVTASYGEAALLVEGYGSVSLTGEGALNVSGQGYGVHGVYARDGSTATVTNTMANGDFSYGAAAYAGSTVMVGGNATATGMNCAGAYAMEAAATITIAGNATAEGDGAAGALAMNNGAVTVGGDAMAGGYYCFGAFAGDGIVTVNANAIATGINGTGAHAVGGTITVGGDATADGESGCGASAIDGGVVTVSGSTTAEGEYSYGARAYSFDGTNSSVKVTANATAIGSNSYGAYTDGVNSSVEVGQTAAASGEGSYGAYALNGGAVTVGVNATADGVRSCGAFAGVEGSSIEIDQTAMATGNESYGAFASEGGTITVGFNATVSGDTYCIGAYADGGTISIGGDATAEANNSRGAQAVDGGTITVSGGATAIGRDSYGAYAGDAGSSVEVGTNAAADGEGSYGVLADYGGTVMVAINATASGTYSCAARVSFGGIVSVGGSAIATGEQSNGAYIFDGGTIAVKINATADGDSSCGIRIIDGGTATVGGNVTASGYLGCGANIYGGGEAIIDGIVDAPMYVSVNNTEKIASNGVRGTTPYEDYLIYSKSTSIVRIKIQLSLTITTTTLPAATIGTAYSRTVAVDYTGNDTLIYSATGLPNGLSMNTGTGVISGTPAAGTNLASPYIVTVGVTDGKLTDSKILSLAVNVAAAAPVINTQPANVTSNIGQTATFTVAATSPDGGTLSYRWQRSTNGGTTWSNATGTGTTSASYTTGTLAFTNNANQYRCTITNSKNGTTAVINSNAAILTVNPAAAAPVINTQPADVTRNVGQTATFTIAAVAPDSGILTYQWQRYPSGSTNWSNITGATSASYTTGTLALSDSGSRYRCVVTNSKNATTAVINSNAGTLTINPAALFITTVSLSDATVGSPYSKAIEYSYTGTGTLVFSAAGLPGGLLINASTGLISGTPDDDADSSSPYSVEVEVTDGTLTHSKSFSLVVNAGAQPNTPPSRKPGIPATATASVRVNTAYTLDLSAIFEDTDGDPLTYRVSVNNGAVVFANTNYSYTPSVTGTTTLEFTANDGMADSTDTYKVILTARSSGSSGGGSSGSGSSGNGSPTVITPDKKPDQPVVAGTTVTATTGNNGFATATIPQAIVTNAIAAAQTQASQQNKAANGIGVAVSVNAPSTAHALGIVLTQPTLQRLITAQVQSFTVEGRQVSIDFDLLALQEIQRQSTGNVTITITPAQNLSAAARALIGTRPVYNMTITYVRNRHTAFVTGMNRGAVSIRIPYVPAVGEYTGNLYAAYVNGSGKVTLIPNSSYDSGTQSILFWTDHFSVYGVAYQPPAAKFTDTSKHWAKEAIDYMVSRQILDGATDTTFLPDAAMSRGMLAAALGRLAGADVSSYQTSGFTDVKAGTYYLPYIEWACKKGIISGIGNKQFAPDKAVTREELAAILQNYAKATGYILPVTREAITFADNSSISSLAANAVKAMQQAGIMAGERSNKFNPKASATRAEVAAALQRYVKLTIDPATTQGWARNDDGQWLYYKDGKAISGWQTIDGKKYSFNANGILTNRRSEE